MKLPNGYGSVVNLGKGRRKPYAVRITTGRKKNIKGEYVQTYKYLEYFQKSKDAYAYLAAYNRGDEVKEHTSLVSAPTMKEVFENWFAHRQGLRKKPSEATIRNYIMAFNRFEELHDRKFSSLRPADYQPIANVLSEKSNSTVGMSRTVLNQMYEWAIKNELVEKNYCLSVTWEYTNSAEECHAPFTDDEIAVLWNNSNLLNVDKVLMLIYSGLRPKEFLQIETKNINLKEHYFIAGMKTAAGTNRTIPIHNSVYQYYQRYYNLNNKYLFQNTRGNPLQYHNFRTNYWYPLMQQLHMDHKPHDPRHTFATLADKYAMNDFYTKLIMGHSINDLTKGTYTHVTPDILLKDINKIQTP